MKNIHWHLASLTLAACGTVALGATGSFSAGVTALASSSLTSYRTLTAKPIYPDFERGAAALFGPLRGEDGPGDASVVRTGRPSGPHRRHRECVDQA